MSSVLDRPADFSRETQVERIWQAFGDEMGATVQAILDGNHPPSEVVSAIAEVVGSYFRTHGLALADAELRRLAAERLCRSCPASPLVAFARLPDCPWTGGEVAQSGSVVPDESFGEVPLGLVRFASDRRQSPAPAESQWAD